MEDRLQWALQQIIGDESLTGDLEDNEAQRLLDWGVSQAKQLVQQSAALDETGAQEFLDTQLQALRRTIRRINKLVGSISSAAPDEIDQRLRDILDSAGQAQALRVERPADTSAVARRLGGLAPAEALRQVMALFGEGAQAAPQESTLSEAPTATSPSSLTAPKPYVPPDIPKIRPGAPPKRPAEAAEPPPAPEKPSAPPTLPRLRPGAPPERPAEAAEPAPEEPPPPPPTLPRLRPGAPPFQSAVRPGGEPAADDESAAEPPGRDPLVRE